MTSLWKDILPYLYLAVIAFEDNKLAFNIIKKDSKQSKSCIIYNYT